MSTNPFDEERENIEEPWDEKNYCAKKEETVLLDAGELPPLSLKKKNRKKSRQSTTAGGFWKDEMPEDELIMGAGPKVSLRYTRNVTSEIDSTGDPSAIEVEYFESPRKLSLSPAVFSTREKVKTDSPRRVDLSKIYGKMIETKEEEKQQHSIDFPLSTKLSPASVTTTQEEAKTTDSTTGWTSPQRNYEKEIVEEEKQDVYSCFSEYEKCKFLKMVNSGISSTKSVKNILEERGEDMRELSQHITQLKNHQSPPAQINSSSSTAKFQKRDDDGMSPDDEAKNDTNSNNNKESEEQGRKLFS